MSTEELMKRINPIFLRRRCPVCGAEIIKESPFVDFFRNINNGGKKERYLCFRCSRMPEEHPLIKFCLTGFVTEDLSF